MLICAGQKPGLDAQGPLPARNGVAHRGGVGVPQVRPRVHVVDGRGEVKAGWILCKVGHGRGVRFNSSLRTGGSLDAIYLFILGCRAGSVKLVTTHGSVRIGLENQGYSRHSDVYLELQKRLGERVRAVLRAKFDLELENIPLETPPDLQFGELDRKSVV